MKTSNPPSAFHTGCEIGHKSSFAPNNIPEEISNGLPAGRLSAPVNSLITHCCLETTKDESRFKCAENEKADVEYQLQKLDQEILEKQHTLKLIQEALNNASKDFLSISSSRLAAGLAHEIRNPLTTIMGFIQLLKPELHAIGKQELAEIALEEITRANCLLSEFLSVLKPSSSAKKRLSINLLASNIHKLFTSEAILKGINFSVDMPKEELFMMADENSIKQVLVNLLKNAMESVQGISGKKGEVKMKVEKYRGLIFIRVIDNGTGIDEYTLKKIFTPFYTTKTGGTGIGLTISKQIIEDHEGQISVTSEGSRTMFMMHFPLYKSQHFDKSKSCHIELGPNHESLVK
jgi:signal transduction histidine kinase